jgi:uncharacterized membrane protein YdjX (TVP38/TMEM64 family)
MVVDKLVMQNRQWRKIGICLAIGLMTALLFRYTPLMNLFDQAMLVMELNKLGKYAVFAFILAHLVSTMVGIPGTVLTVAGGVVFGVFYGTLWSVIGATLGAIAAFWLARTLLHDWAAHHFEHHPAMARFKQSLQQHPLNFVLAVRFAPISPFNVVNFLFGLTPIDARVYAIGTLLGIIPGTLAYTWLGAAGIEALHGGSRLPLVLALALLTLLSLLPMLGKSWQKWRRNCV